jgi:dihydroorotase
VVLRKSAQVVQESLSYAEDQIVPLAAGQSLDWSFQGLVN